MNALSRATYGALSSVTPKATGRTCVYGYRTLFTKSTESKGTQTSTPPSLATFADRSKYLDNKAYVGFRNQQFEPPLRLYTRSGELATELYRETLLETFLTKDSKVSFDSIVSQIHKDLGNLSVLVKNKIFNQAITQPSTSQAALKKFVNSVATDNQFGPFTKAFLDRVLASKELPLIPEVLADYDKLVNALLQRYTVNVEVADKASVPDTNAIIEAFNFPKTAQVEFQVTENPSLLSGWVASTDDKRLDRSLVTKADALRRALNEDARMKEARRRTAIEKDLGL